ncbi:hypothetical protein H9P43_002534 [Blastocladiella emersonii ATCC 22665]|nr:hypothetical protein H9P43_002534 [Blastocladiella emersonii ATCC 22665]
MTAHANHPSLVPPCAAPPPLPSDGPPGSPPIRSPATVLDVPTTTPPADRAESSVTLEALGHSGTHLVATAMPPCHDVDGDSGSDDEDEDVGLDAFPSAIGSDPKLAPSPWRRESRVVTSGATLNATAADPSSRPDLAVSAAKSVAVAPPPPQPAAVATKDDVVGPIDHLIRFISTQSTTPIYPRWFGDISRLHFGFTCALGCLWVFNQVQIAQWVAADLATAPLLSRAWLTRRPGTSDTRFTDAITLVFLAAYVKELVRLAMWLHLVLVRRVTAFSKYQYAFVTYSGLMLPLLFTSSHHVSAIVKSKAYDVIVSPEVVILDLVTVDLPQAAKAIYAFYRGTATGSAQLTSLWTTVSVGFKMSRFLWKVVLAIHQQQLIQRARARRSLALLEWTHALQHAVGVVGSPAAASAVAARMPRAVLASGGRDPTARAVDEFTPVLTSVLECTAIVGHQALWRVLRGVPVGSGASLASGGGGAGGLGSARELRLAAKETRLALALRGPAATSQPGSAAGSAGNLGTSETLTGGGARSPSGSVTAVATRAAAAAQAPRKGSIVALTTGVLKRWSLTGGSGASPAASTESADAPPGAPVPADPVEQELCAVVLAHADALAYLERTPPLDVVVTDDVVAAVRAVWGTRAMQAVVSRVRDAPAAAWHDRVMAAWPRDVTATMRAGEVVGMLAFRLKLVAFCLDRSEKFLRRSARLKVNDVMQCPHSAAEMVLGDAFGVPAAPRVVSRADLTFALFPLAPAGMAMQSKLLDLANLFVVTLHLDEFDVVVPATAGPTGEPRRPSTSDGHAAGGETTQLLETIRLVEQLLPVRERGRRVILVCLGVPEFKEKLAAGTISPDFLRRHYRKLVHLAGGGRDPRDLWDSGAVAEYLRQALAKVNPVARAALLTDENGLDACMLALLLEFDVRTQQGLLNTADIAME